MVLVENKEERIKDLMRSYDRNKHDFDEFNDCITGIVRGIINRSNINPHSITSRRKERQSFLKKIKKPGKTYYSLSDITDLLGVRITTYFENEVDSIKEIIEKEFCIDKANSIDKRKLHDPDRFGYMSLHYIISLKESRLKLPEYSAYRGMKVEIQIRSILQHTWAEIEHDLGYKSKYAIPMKLKRRFSQLASLLELADREFKEIRNEIERYENNVLECLNQADNEIAIDKNSIIIITEHDKDIIDLDKKVCSVTGAKLTENHDFSENIANMLLWIGVRRISELKNYISEYGGMIKTFAEKWIKQKDYKEFNHGVSIMYTCYLILAKEGKVSKINKFAKDFELGLNIKNFGKYLIQNCIEIPVNKK